MSGIVYKMAKAMEPYTFEAYERVESGEYKAIHGFEDVLDKVRECKDYAVIGLHALTEQDLMQLLAHKLKMEDKMLALVGIENIMPHTYRFAKGGLVEKDKAIITYGVEK